MLHVSSEYRNKYIRYEITHTLNHAIYITTGFVKYRIGRNNTINVMKLAGNFILESWWFDNYGSLSMACNHGNTADKFI